MRFSQTFLCEEFQLVNIIPLSNWNILIQRENDRAPHCSSPSVSRRPQHTSLPLSFHFLIPGPNVTPSISRLLMICAKELKEIKKRFQLSNESEAPAIFMFDVDQTQCPFKLGISRGTIAPNNQLWITVTFVPTEQGLYAFYLTCLILYQV